MAEKRENWNTKVKNAAIDLFEYCEKENYKGWDPYDGLNSKIFKATFLNRIPFFRLAWIQLFKRNPINLRKIMLIPKGHNSKGIGLFLSAYSKLYAAQQKGVDVLPELGDLRAKVIELGDLLLSMISMGYSGACWGYNFDWQARGGLYFKSNVPTVVATTYAANGLFEAYEVTGEKRFLDAAMDAANFVLKDLNRDYRPSGSFLFSYSVGHGNNTVYNASLLGSKLLARTYHYSKDASLLEPAKGSIGAALEAQEEDGSWVYGELPIQSWKDSYHTGFNIESIYDYMRYSGDDSVREPLERGLKYYLENFFTESGEPKYYHNKTYPIDIHSPAQLAVTVCHLSLFKEQDELVQCVLNWTLDNMKDKKGFFYYQMKPGKSSKIPYMRWSQAWMAHALAVYLIEQKKSS